MSIIIVCCAGSRQVVAVRIGFQTDIPDKTLAVTLKSASCNAHDGSLPAAVEIVRNGHPHGHPMAFEVSVASTKTC